MITLISICDLFWLFWLLPFLLGALLWWMGNSKYDKMVAEYDAKIKSLNNRITGLNSDLSDCSSKRADLEGDLALTKGRMREMEADANTLKAKLKGTKESTTKNTSISGGISHTSSLAADVDNTYKGAESSTPSFTDSTDTDTTSESKILDDDIKDTAQSVGASALASSGLQTGNDTIKSASDSPSGSGSKAKSIYRGIKSDNLQIIEGIGPKMQSILKENGVKTLADLADNSTAGIQAILDKYGDKYKIIDPLTWVQQAGYAKREDFDGLIDLQKKLDTGKDNASGTTASKLEKYLIKTGAIKSFKLDDLKAIEGIGPATEKLLNSNGINTWRELANSKADDIKGMLKAAGSRFALGDPTTWPKQAELAADGKFDELREYQDFLDGGRG